MPSNITNLPFSLLMFCFYFLFIFISRHVYFGSSSVFVAELRACLPAYLEPPITRANQSPSHVPACNTRHLHGRFLLTRTRIIISSYARNFCVRVWITTPRTRRASQDVILSKSSDSLSPPYRRLVYFRYFCLQLLTP